MFSLRKVNYLGYTITGKDINILHARLHIRLEM